MYNEIIKNDAQLYAESIFGDLNKIPDINIPIESLRLNNNILRIDRQEFIGIDFVELTEEDEYNERYGSEIARIDLGISTLIFDDLNIDDKISARLIPEGSLEY